ncbi:MAG TPA: hypothetical protein VGS22_25330 [Thermoanaerobaculia bacterium]|jgi:hypothetical protein|nr:hypothetical protein [Thermoanaerobaculia bacterium]
MKPQSRRPLLLVALLAALFAQASLAANPGQCPAIHRPMPTAEERQHLEPLFLLRCFLSIDEIDLVAGSLDHDAQTSVTDPAFDSGELNPDGSLRPPLSGAQIAALIKMHSVLDPDMRAGAIIRKFIPNSDVGGFLFGRTVIGSPASPQVVTTNTVRGFVGLERNTNGLGAGETVAALGLDFETTALGQFTDATQIPFRRKVAAEILAHGLHSIRHIMVAQGASDAKIPLAKDLREAAVAAAALFSSRSFEMNRNGQSNPYTGLGYSADIGLLTLKVNDGDAGYPLHLNEEDVMTVPTPLAVGDELLRRKADGSDRSERVVARYLPVRNPDGTVTNQWVVARNLPRALALYYSGLYSQAAARVAAAGG